MLSSKLKTFAFLLLIAASSYSKAQESHEVSALQSDYKESDAQLIDLTNGYVELLKKLQNLMSRNHIALKSQPEMCVKQQMDDLDNLIKKCPNFKYILQTTEATEIILNDRNIPPHFRIPYIFERMDLLHKQTLKKWVSLNISCNLCDHALFQCCTKTLEACKLLLECININYFKEPYTGNTLLIQAVNTGNSILVKFLLEQGAIKETKNFRNETALDQAKECLDIYINIKENRLLEDVPTKWFGRFREQTFNVATLFLDAFRNKSHEIEEKIRDYRYIIRLLTPPDPYFNGPHDGGGW